MIDMAYVVPAFDAAATIGATLRSVLGQRGPRLGVVVVDDGSADGTGDEARSTRDWRVEVVRQGNGGLASARNTGLEVLEDRAPIVCFLDADDTVEPGHAEALCRALGAADRRSRASDLAACGYRMVGPELEDLGWTIDVSAGEADLSRLLAFNPFAVGAMGVRVDALRTVAGPRPFDESLPVHEDWDLWLRLTAAGCRWAEPVHEPLFNYRVRPGSLSRGVERMWREGQRVIGRAPISGAGAARVVEEAQRHWTVRHLARAATAAPELVGPMLADLETRGGRELGASDRAALLGSLRHALLLEHGVGPGRAIEHESAWREMALMRLADWPESHAAIGALAFSSWEGVADRLSRLLARGGAERAPGRLAHLRPVVAGMGRNGRALAGALARRGIAFDWLDEDPSAACPLAGSRRLALSQVAPRHLLIVTPVAGDALAARLRETRGLVLLPRDLLGCGRELAPSREFSGRRVA